MMRYALPVALAGLLSACAPNPPSQWPQGGARLEIPRARWSLVESAVDIVPDGSIFVNAEHVLTVDRAGRVVNKNREPIALVLTDGRLLGPADTDMGSVGMLHASLAGEPNAWISVMPSGEVVRYFEDGERQSFGAWMGCNISPRTQMTCTLVTHIVGMRIKEEQDRMRSLNQGLMRGGMMPIPTGLGFGSGW